MNGSKVIHLKNQKILYLSIVYHELEYLRSVFNDKKSPNGLINKIHWFSKKKIPVCLRI